MAKKNYKGLYLDRAEAYLDEDGVLKEEHDQNGGRFDHESFLIFEEDTLFVDFGFPSEESARRWIDWYVDPARTLIPKQELDKEEIAVQAGRIAFEEAWDTPTSFSTLPDFKDLGYCGLLRYWLGVKEGTNGEYSLETRKTEEAAAELLASLVHEHAEAIKLALDCCDMNDIVQRLTEIADAKKILPIEWIDN